MPIEELLAVVPAPAMPLEVGARDRWSEVQRELGIKLPDDYRDYATHYGSGYIDDQGHLMLFVLNPLAANYRGELEKLCDELRQEREEMPREPNVPYGVFPHRPGWLPWGIDIDGSLLCWLTEGDPNEWPLVLLSSERTSFQQLSLPMTSFLAFAISRKVTTFLWNDSEFFADCKSVRFQPIAYG